jgi:hypothetical protein
VSAFDKTIELAKRQLPAAFTVGGGLPYPARAVVPKRVKGALANPVALVETAIPTGAEDVRDFEDTFKELGFEAIAFYVSFHRPTPQGLWGIFYFDHRIRQFAEVIRREFQLQPDDAAHLAARIVRAHEQFHFRFDAYALYNELILHKPLYNEYSKCVYRAVYCTPDCFEEAVANRSCLESEHARRHFGLRIYNKHQIRPFLKKLFAKAPPGYSDYGRPVDELCSGLGGQLFEAKSSARLPKPQSEWVYRAFSKANCRESFLLDKLDHDGKPPEFTFPRRIGGYKWRVHKNDPDTWPSKPHAHDYEENVKLNIKAGSVWDVTTQKRIGCVKKSDLVELRNGACQRL